MRGKKVKGRKRHALVDTLGLPEVLQVTGADVQDRDGGRAVLEIAPAHCPRLTHGWMDGAYQALVEWADKMYQWTFEVVKRPSGPAGLRRPAMPVGSRAAVRVVQPLSAVEQRL